MKSVQEHRSQNLGIISIIHPTFCWRIFSQIASFPLIHALSWNTYINHYLHFAFNIISRIISFNVFASPVRDWKKISYSPGVPAARTRKCTNHTLIHRILVLLMVTMLSPNCIPQFFMLHLVYFAYICFTLIDVNILEMMHQPRRCWKSWGSANGLHLLVISDIIHIYVHLYIHVKYEMQQKHALKNPSAVDYTFPWPLSLKYS